MLIRALLALDSDKSKTLVKLTIKREALVANIKVHYKSKYLCTYIIYVYTLNYWPKLSEPVAISRMRAITPFKRYVCTIV